jgi:thermostable 8-oxoguanine DNA glycosylase
MNLTKPFLSVVLVAVLAFYAAHANAEAPDGAKIDKILQQQEMILKNLAELKEEVRVVKVRVTSGN